jgi:hypothetical protein
MEKQDIIINALTTGKVSQNDAVDIISEYLQYIDKYDDNLVRIAVSNPMMMQQALPVALNGLLPKYNISKLLDKDGNLIKYIK